MHRHDGWSTAVDPRESVPAALGILYLADGDPAETILGCANFGRDDSERGPQRGVSALRRFDSGDCRSRHHSDGSKVPVTRHPLNSRDQLTIYNRAWPGGARIIAA